MLILLSPAKTLDFDSPPRVGRPREPQFLDQAESLARTAARCSAPRLRELMSLSESLATLNRDRFRAWERDHAGEAVRPAIQAFRGDVYVGLDADTLDEHDLAFADQRLRILSGLYGVLRPFDAMRPHRLEMGTRLPTRRGKTLYDFWGDRVASRLDEEAEAIVGDRAGDRADDRADEPGGDGCVDPGADPGGATIVNLASNEYFKVVGRPGVRARVISPVFRDEKNGAYKVVSFFAKRARGAMARHLVQARADSARALRDFDGLGYRYSVRESTDDVPVFRRSAKAAAPFLANAG